MKKKIDIQWGLLILFLGIILSLYYFSQNRFQNRVVDQIEVKFTSVDNHFITQKMVNNLLKQNFPDQSNVRIKDLDLDKLEQGLTQNEMIENAELYFDAKGVLYAEVQQKTAIARILENQSSYYIDSKGNKMPLSREFSAHIPIVVGEISKNNRKQFLELIQKINQDEFLKTTVTGIQILSNQSVNITVRDYKYLIEFGTLKEIDKKIENYKAFVHYAKTDTLINKYKKVNLRFTEQVICTK